MEVSKDFYRRLYFLISMRMIGLQVRIWLTVVVLFGLLYALISIIAYVRGISAPFFYVVLALIIIGIQYLIGPKIVEMTMRIRYITPSEYPRLYSMVERLARDAKIPMPKVGISEIPIPNAFAFGRTKGDARVCVTRELLNILDEKELEAVLGHEISHIKHRDVVVITMLSVIPLVCYYVFLSTLFSGDRESRGSTALIGIAAFILYFVTNLLVLYASRIREYYADSGSVELTKNPTALASALYKLIRGSARVDKTTLKHVEGLKAFFASDPSNARKEITELSMMDLDRSGDIDEYELKAFGEAEIKLTAFDKFLEFLSTHPNPAKRIQRLAHM